MSDTEWTVEEMAALLDAAPLPPTPQSVKPPARTPSPFAQALRDQFRAERAARHELEAQVADLQREVMELRSEIGVQQRVAGLAVRLERLEAASGKTLRSVVG
jgi:hypothetical protein